MKMLRFGHERLDKLTDGLAVALAISLPWSTSATGILAALWLLAFIPTCDLSSLRRIVTTPAGGMPILLLALGAAGTLWADIAWAERANGMSSLLKLLFIPLLLCQFSRSNRGPHVLIGFLGSCVLLLIASWATYVWPQLPILSRNTGVPVKDYISQGAMFTICIFVSARLSFDYWRGGRRYLALALAGLALIFLANIFYIATSRTSLVVLVILVSVFGYRQFGLKGVFGLIGSFVLLVAIAWPTANFLQQRVGSFLHEVESYHPGGQATPAGERLEFWKKSIAFIEMAPIVGHGTGSIREQFSRAIVGQTGMAAEVSTNPHNQILAIGIQLGFVGIAVLLALWTAHLALFWSNSVAAWTGLVFVIQNIIGSLFNSHLADFTHGWLYVVGVGVAGGIALREASRAVGSRQQSPAP